MTYSDDVRTENRLTVRQVDLLDLLSGFEDDESTFVGVAMANTNIRTMVSLDRRGLIVGGPLGWHLTNEGADILAAYV